MTFVNPLVDYIKELPYKHKEILYSSPLFCTSFIKVLEEDTSRFIYDLLLYAPNIKTLQHISELKNSLKLLLKLQLIYKTGSNIYLNEIYRKSFLSGICIIENNIFFAESTNTDDETLLNKAEYFDDILKYIVDKESEITNSNILELLLFGNLIDKNRDITNQDFEFLLKTKYEQIWNIIVLGLKYYCENTEDQINNLISLFELSEKKINVHYSFSNSTKDKKLSLNTKFYGFLEILGLLKIKDNVVTTNIYFENIFTKTTNSSSKFIIIETNFKIYAYTKSVYEISIIKLFSNVVLHLPNLIKGLITEESISNACAKGVTSSQIIHFLNSSLKCGTLPETISNQISIWENKRNRIKVYPGYLYSHFLNLIDYQKVLKFCIEKDCLIEKDTERRILVVKREHNEIVKDFIKSIK